MGVVFTISCLFYFSPRQFGIRQEVLEVVEGGGGSCVVKFEGKKLLSFNKLLLSFLELENNCHLHHKKVSTRFIVGYCFPISCHVQLLFLDHCTPSVHSKVVCTVKFCQMRLTETGNSVITKVD